MVVRAPTPAASVGLLLGDRSLGSQGGVGEPAAQGIQLRTVEGGIGVLRRS